MSEELNLKSEIDAKLSTMTPPAVRALEGELKNMLQQIVQSEFSKVAEKDEQMSAFLKQFGLPQVLHSVSASNDVPDPVWTKIEEFQRKGSSQNFAKAIEGAQSLKQVNLDVLNACKQTLEAEEQEDTQLRTQHGTAFNRPPSSTVNQAYKQSIFDYQNKIDMAVATDQQITTKYEANREGFELLSKTRQDIASMIPQSASSGQIESDPAVMGVKDCLA